MMQLFLSNKGFVKVYDVKSEKELINTLKLFCKEVWAPKAFMVNGARTEKSNKVRQFLNKVGTTLRVLEGETMAKVIRRSIDVNGNVIGDLDKTPSLNKLIYNDPTLKNWKGFCYMREWTILCHVGCYKA